MDITEERLVKIRDVLFKSPTFESCMLSFPEDEIDPEFLLMDEYERLDYEFGEFSYTVSQVMRAHPAYNARNKRFSIEGTNSYFQLKIDKDDAVSLHIDKKTL
ncbi:hypothetical protein CAEBREN_23766 [Caenorhabditis brenneri]|uniref:DUF38 domain-containing protein n=1 Tax=Caenorhabditis brenneri TaxID=135651 RepID=G0NGH1_CAEBE|nr:hypothetical protein CAEBREN_23766 [Caenorhabditis brenneri]